MDLSARFYSTLMLFLASILISSSGTFEDVIIIDNFKTGGPDYVIAGKKARVNGNRVLIDHIKARLYQNNGEIYLFSPECDFDQNQKTGYSNQPVHIRNKNMTIDGVGFELDIEQSRVVVKKDVRVKIYNYRDDLLGE